MRCCLNVFCVLFHEKTQVYKTLKTDRNILFQKKTLKTYIPWHKASLTDFTPFSWLNKTCLRSVKTGAFLWPCSFWKWRALSLITELKLSLFLTNCSIDPSFYVWQKKYLFLCEDKMCQSELNVYVFQLAQLG